MIRRIRCSRPILAALLLLALLAPPLAAEAHADETRRSSLQVAALHGMTHTDAGTHVLLQRDCVRLRMYPGTDTLLIAGKQYTVKDRFVREGGRVMVTARVQRFLNRQIAAACRDAKTYRLQVATPRASTLPPLKPLPPRVTRAKRKPIQAREVATVTPTKKRLAGGDPRWVPGTTERAWKWIILHHSDDRSGNLAKYDDVHRNTNKWENGCGYHFVVGNGSQSGDGEIEMSERWRRQIQGAHAKVPGNRFNEHGIGICLVGDFDEGGRRPTPAQMEELVRLIRWLKDRYGIQDCDVRGHSDCCATQCPGRHFPWAELRARTR